MTVALAGCAQKTGHAPSTAAAPAPVLAPVPAPAAATGTKDGQQLPAGNLAVVWQMRVALNVAALVCRGGGSASLVAGYNGMLRDRRTLLAAAEAALIGQYGSARSPAYDAAMTRLYNFYARPAATAAFCVVAERVQQVEAGVQLAGYLSFATRALVDLNAPFAGLRSTSARPVPVAARKPVKRRRR
jgi:hypothetical protein